MSPKQRRAYEEHVDTLRSQGDVLDTAREEGLAEGRAEGLAQGIEKGIEKGIETVARNMISLGWDNDSVSTATGLPEAVIAAIRQNLEQHSR